MIWPLRNIHLFLETLGDTESNNELEESEAVQDHDSSLYYSLEESQRKSPNANQKNPPRNKTKNGVDFGVQFSYSPRIESKKVQTNINTLDQGNDMIIKFFQYFQFTFVKVFFSKKPEVYLGRLII